MKPFLTFVCLSLALCSGYAKNDKPNLVFILTDNHGAWTLGCYGNKEIRTPNIDRLAAEGVLFSRAFCNNSVCSPSRATFLTGLIPSQHGVHSYIAQQTQTGANAYNTIAEFSTLPKILSKAGYACGLAGKWHLGANLHPQEGFTYWFTKAGGHTSTFYNDDAVWDGKIYKEPGYMTEVITDHAVKFLESNHDRPFFLYLAYNGPYGLGKVVEDEHESRHNAYYADKEMNSYPRAEVSPWARSNRSSVNNVKSMRNYAAAVSGVDDGVGRVMETLKKLGVDKNTLVVFSADQGLNAGHNGYWGMGDHSRPINTLDATVRIPLIFRHPEQIPAGKVSDLANHDFLPTVLEHLGLKEQTPSQPPLPGHSFAPVLTGREIKWDNVIFHDFENTRMIRTEEWKLTLRYNNGPDELYNIKNDPDERRNLIHVPQHKDVKVRLTKRLEDFFAKYADPKYDLWNGGISKAPRLTR